MTIQSLLLIRHKYALLKAWLHTCARLGGRFLTSLPAMLRDRQD